MWRRKELKEKARKVVKKNYWTAIIVCFLIAILTGEFGTSIIWKTDDSIDPNYAINQENIIVENEVNEEKIQEAQEKSQEIEEKKSNLNDIELKILDAIQSNFNSLIKSQKYIFKIWDAIELFNINQLYLGIGLILTALIAVAYIIILAEPLTVGEKRYFIKTRVEEDTKIGAMGEIFKKGSWKNVAITMILKDIYNLLWFLTIIGGFIKIYEYKMIPYILAENPKIERKKVFQLSKEMMKGNKWRAFILDLSFIFWSILSIFTFGILNILYVNPYKVATSTELYVALKQKVIEDKCENYEEIKEIK